jgi:preprotein translocase subunit SecG
MIRKYLMFAVALVAVATVAVAAMEIAVLSQIQQDADAKGCTGGGTGFNASKGKCFKPDL